MRKRRREKGSSEYKGDGFGKYVRNEPVEGSIRIGRKITFCSRSDFHEMLDREQYCGDHSRQVKWQFYETIFFLWNACIDQRFGISIDLATFFSILNIFQNFIKELYFLWKISMDQYFEV